MNVLFIISTDPIAWMDDLYELSMEADKVFSF